MSWFKYKTVARFIVAMGLMVVISGCTLFKGDITLSPADLTAMWETAQPREDATPSPEVGETPTPGEYVCPSEALALIVPGNAAEVDELGWMTPAGLVDGVLAPGGGLLAILTEQDALVYSLDCSQDQVQIPLAEYGQPIAYALADNSLALSFAEQGVRLWRLPGGEEGEVLSTEATQIAYSADGSVLATVQETTLELWQVATGERLHQWTLRRPVANLGFSPDGSMLAIELLGDIDDPIELWDVSSGELIGARSWSERAGPIYFVRFSPDWSTLAWVSRGTVLIMETENSAALSVLGHEDYVDVLAYSPDGSLVATTSAAEVEGEFVPVVTLWWTETGQKAALLIHAEPVMALAYSPDGQLMTTGSFDGAIGLWEVPTGERLALLADHQDVIRSMFFALEGRLLVTLSTDGSVRFWGLAPAR